MALTKITADILKDNTIVVGDLAATGTPTSSKALQGDDAWATLSTSGTLNIAAADPGTGETSGNTWYLSGLINFVTDSLGISGVWTTGGVLNYARDYPANSGNQKAGLIVSDETADDRQKCEEYDGITWTNANPTVQTLWYTTMFGSQSASVECLGNNPVATTNNANEYDGTSWAASNNVQTPRKAPGSSGTLSAGLTFGGQLAPGPAPGSTEEYDGTTWVTSNNMTTGVVGPRGAGIQTATVAAGGYTLPNTVVSTSAEYDGTSWTTQNALLTGRRHYICFGSMTSAISAGGSATSPSGNLDSTEYYDGTCWSGRTNLLQEVNSSSGGGSSNAGFTAGGYDGAALNATEEWVAPLVQFVAV